MIRTLLSSIACLLLVGCTFGSSVAQEAPSIPTAQVVATAPTPTPTAQIITSMPMSTAQIVVTAPTPTPTAQIITPTSEPTAQVVATAPTPTPAVQTITPTSEPTAQVVATASTPTPTVQIVTEEVFKGSAPSLYFGRPSLEEDIAWSSFIIRGTFDSVRAVGVRSERLAPGEYIGGLEYTFTVHEYLKGSGGSKLRGVAIVWHGTKADTADAAADLAKPHIDYRDTRWDGRQAIVFMRQTEEEKDFLWMGSTDSIMLGGEYPKWLPDAAATSTAQGGAGTAAQRFLLEDPDPNKASSSTARIEAAASSLSIPHIVTPTPLPTPTPQAIVSASKTVPTISLTDLKSRVNAMEARIAAGGGSQAYRECIYSTYVFNREISFAGEYSRRDGAIQSGLPAGTRMVEYTDAIWINIDRFGQTAPTWMVNNIWYEGKDAALFGYEYPGYAISKRPLPAGEYRAFSMWRREAMTPCKGYPKALRGLNEHIVTVTAPRGTLHEAFFDPVVNTSTSAVGADGSLGALKPTDFRVTGYSGFRRVTSTTTMKGLYWGNNKVRMEFAGSAPRTELSGSFVDVIGLDGKVSLTLDFNKSSLSSDGKSLSWDASKQPWKAGDKLMLRIREGMAGIGGESREPGSSSGASGSGAGR